MTESTGNAFWCRLNTTVRRATTAPQTYSHGAAISDNSWKMSSLFPFSSCLYSGSTQQSASRMQLCGRGASLRVRLGCKSPTQFRKLRSHARWDTITQLPTKSLKATACLTSSGCFYAVHLSAQYRTCSHHRSGSHRICSTSTSCRDLTVERSGHQTIANDNATKEVAEYFAFEDSAVGNRTPAERRGIASCRPFPGDSTWASKIIWTIFDVLLGRALIPTTPVTSSCYDTKWAEKTMFECERR